MNIYRYFSTVDEYADWANKTPRDNSCSSMEHNYDDWAGKLSLEKAFDALRYGLPVSTSALDAARKRIPIKPCLTIDTELAVEGTVPDVATYLAGEPECMLSFNPVIRPVRTLTIAYNITASCNIHHEVLYARGAAITAIVDSLEMRGVRCGLYAYWCVGPSWSSGDGRHVLCVQVKQPDQPLDLSRVAFTAHPAFMRRITFAACEAEDESTRIHFGFNSHSGYGHVIKPDVPVLPNDEHADYNLQHCTENSEAAAIARVFEQFPVELINDA